MPEQYSTLILFLLYAAYKSGNTFFFSLLWFHLTSEPQGFTLGLFGAWKAKIERWNGRVVFFFFSLLLNNDLQGSYFVFKHSNRIYKPHLPRSHLYKPRRCLREEAPCITIYSANVMWKALFEQSIYLFRLSLGRGKISPCSAIREYLFKKKCQLIFNSNQ